MKLPVLSFVLTAVVDGATATSSVRKRTNVDDEKVEVEELAAGGKRAFSIENLDDAAKDQLQSAFVRISQHGTKNLIRHISSSLHDVSDGSNSERKLISQTCIGVRV